MADEPKAPKRAFSITMDEDLLDAVKAAAAEERRSTSSMIQQLCVRALEAQEPAS